MAHQTVTLSSGKEVTLLMPSKVKEIPWGEWYDEDAILAIIPGPGNYPQISYKAGTDAINLNYSGSVSATKNGILYDGEKTIDGPNGSKLQIYRYGTPLNLTTSEFTVEGWYNFTDPWTRDVGTQGYYYAQDNDTYNRLYIQQYANNIRFSCGNAGAEYSQVFLGMQMPRDQWVHVAITHNGSGVFNVWINGDYKGGTSIPLGSYPLNDMDEEHIFLGNQDPVSIAKYQIVPREKYTPSINFTPLI